MVYRVQAAVGFRRFGFKVVVGLSGPLNQEDDFHQRDSAADPMCDTTPHHRCLSNRPVN